MGARTKVAIVLMISGAIWISVLLSMGIWHATVKPADGLLSYTFNGWTTQPISRHVFLAQFGPDDFAQGKAYVSATYEFIFFNFLYLAPFHFLLGLPYNIAHNFLSYFYVICLGLLLIQTTKKELLAVCQQRNRLLLSLIFISVGITMTNPMPWISSLFYNRDNVFVVAAGVFCYLSTWVFRNEVPRAPLLIAGIFFAAWSPLFIPPWILAGLFFQRTLRLESRRVLEVAGVCLLGLVNLLLPIVVSRLAGIQPLGSGPLLRSGLDGSTQYVTSIFQAVYAPWDLRHWPAGWHLMAVAILAVYFSYVFRERKYRPVQQGLFLLIPYSTTVILFPQMSSIHPYLTDVLLLVPASFLISFWCLQQTFWEKLDRETFAVSLLTADLIIITNLLVLARMPRLVYGDRNIVGFVLLVVFGLLAGLISLVLAHRFPRKQPDSQEARAA